MNDGIDTRALRRLDLNLLPVFFALLRERSTVRAAESLNIGQPAVSAALSRLRATFDDPLFVRIARGLEPTARALEIGATMAPALSTIQQSLRRDDAFDPATSRSTLRLGVPDHLEQALAPRLLQRMSAHAPGMRLDVRPTHGRTAARMLDNDELDLACGRIDAVSAWQCREPVADVGYLCLFNPALLKCRRLTLDRYLGFSHLLVSAKGDAAGIVDRALEQVGRKRHVVFTTTLFSTLPMVLRQLPMIATLPAHAARLFAETPGLATAPVPIDLPRFETAMVWLARNQATAIHRWFRAIVKEELLSVLRPAGARRQRTAAS